jgi:hypothetical protein
MKTLASDADTESISSKTRRIEGAPPSISP